MTRDQRTSSSPYTRPLPTHETSCCGVYMEALLTACLEQPVATYRSRAGRRRRGARTYSAQFTQEHQSAHLTLLCLHLFTLNPCPTSHARPGFTVGSHGFYIQGMAVLHIFILPFSLSMLTLNPRRCHSSSSSSYSCCKCSSCARRSRSCAPVLWIIKPHSLRNLVLIKASEVPSHDALVGEMRNRCHLSLQPSSR